MLRGDAFEDMSFLDFTVDSYEIQRNHEEENTMEEKDIAAFAHGRKRNLRSGYLEGHPKANTHLRIQRSKNHNYMPNVIGPWFPRRDSIDDEDYYFASVLALLRPWRHIGDLKGDHQTWKDEGLHFLETATRNQRDVIAGMQYYYDSKSAAQHRNEDNEDVMSNEMMDTGLSMGDEDTVENEIKVNQFIKFDIVL
jgi:hypothetical protein